MTADGKIDTFARQGAAISSQRDKERVDQLRAVGKVLELSVVDQPTELTLREMAEDRRRAQRGGPCRTRRFIG